MDINQEPMGGMPIGGRMPAPVGGGMPMPMGGEMPVGGGMSMEPETPPMSMSKGEGLKRQLLQKLISNLLNKPGRSMHELVNGVKDAISAYKNYAKEWDTLNGIAPGGSEPAVEAMSGAVLGGPNGAGSSEEIRRMLQDIQAQKGATDATGGPGINIPRMPQLPPIMRY